MEFPETLFESLNSEDDINALVAKQEPEALYIDFKRKKDPSSPEVDRDLGEALSKAISGFANSAGGVAVLGIDAPQKGEYKKIPFSQLATFEQRVNTHISRATERPVNGIRTKPVPLKADSTTGYLVILVPASDFAPHKSIASGKYYLRIGDSFKPMEHYQLEDAFGRRLHPKLGVAAFLFRVKQQRYSDILLRVHLKNVGRSVARFPLLKLTELAGWLRGEYGPDESGVWNLPPRPGYKEFRGGSNEVLHPLTDFVIVELRTRIDDGQVILGNFEIKGVVAAEGFPIHEFSMKITEGMLLLNSKDGGKTSYRGGASSTLRHLNGLCLFSLEAQDPFRYYPKHSICRFSFAEKASGAQSGA